MKNINPFKTFPPGLTYESWAKIRLKARQQLAHLRKTYQVTPPAWYNDVNALKTSLENSDLEFLRFIHLNLTCRHKSPIGYWACDAHGCHAWVSVRTKSELRSAKRTGWKSAPHACGHESEFLFCPNHATHLPRSFKRKLRENCPEC